MPEIKVGTVSDFFAHPVVAGIELSSELNVGDVIRIKGHTTDLELVISSMQVDNNSVTSAKAGDAIGIKVTERVRPGDAVYKVV
ncbi:MAG: translation elongation factor-like protein [Dehalococcoidales bacterium]|nr:translation elongation factor-like protein [Dehalococcoidales bacterium]MDD3994208.1 translation elongation factor-like protein [Dehalococcoidales bacterium]NLT28322.1 translation elongation factor-like protein [Dehalococcoidales bacterium]